MPTSFDDRALITLLTLHTAKGLSSTTYSDWARRRRFHTAAPRMSLKRSSVRLCYVGMTRAKETLATLTRLAYTVECTAANGCRHPHLRAFCRRFQLNWWIRQRVRSPRWARRAAMGDQNDAYSAEEFLRRVRRAEPPAAAERAPRRTAPVGARARGGASSDPLMGRRVRHPDLWRWHHSSPSKAKTRSAS